MAIHPYDEPHPVQAAVTVMRHLLDGLTDTPVWSLSKTETTQALTDLHRLTASLADLELRIAAHADVLEVAADTGAVTTPLWWAHATHTDRRDAARRLRLAHALGDGRSKVRDALAAGDISEEAATIVVRALDALPTDLDVATTRRAEEVMVAHATELTPRQLRLAGKALLAVIAPDLADAHEEKLLNAEERRAEQAMRLSMWDDGHGTTHGRFALPTLHAVMLRKMLTAIAAPQHQQATHRHTDTEAPGTEAPGTGTGTGTADAAEAGECADGPVTDGKAEIEESTETEGSREGEADGSVDGSVEPIQAHYKPTPQRLAEALCELIERFAAGKLPRAGGTPATVVVTMTLDAFTGADGPATLDTGDRISAGTARRLACQAGILPMVLNGNSVPLDLGRKRRFHSEYQRIAIAHRDQTCTTIGCETPAHQCHVHHDQPWSHGGPTTVKHGRLLCPRHHHHIHDPRYTTTRHPNGKISFTRRT